jgi:hypothetical protein
MEDGGSRVKAVLCHGPANRQPVLEATAMLRCFFLLGSLALLCVSPPLTLPQQKVEEKLPTLTVCEALTHAKEYDGKMVRVRGRISDTMEWTAFRGEDCPGALIIDGKEWPSSIVWTMPDDVDMIIHPVHFTFDQASQKELDKKWEVMKGTVKRSCVAVTYTGMFEVWSKAKARKPVRGGWTEFPGFGHLNGWGAQLVLKSADDLEPIPKCK